MDRHGSSSNCFIPSETRWLALSTSSTTASTVWPFFNSSAGFVTLRDHDISETCTMPSMPSSISTNAPKFVRLRTLPVIFVPGGYFFGTCDHGLASSWRMPRDIFCSSRLISSTSASISSPTFSTSDARATRLVQESSDTCTMPSTPSSNCTNAPYGTTLTTLPRTLLPTGYLASTLSQGLRL